MSHESPARARKPLVLSTPRPQEPDLLAALAMLSRALQTGGLNTQTIAMPGSVFVVQLPSPHWARVMHRAWATLLYRGGSHDGPDYRHSFEARRWLSVDGSAPDAPGNQTGDGALIASCLRDGVPVVGFASDPELVLPGQVLSAATARIGLVGPCVDDIRFVARQLTGMLPAATITDVQAARLQPGMLELARRPGQTADAYVSALLAMSGALPVMQETGSATAIQVRAAGPPRYGAIGEARPGFDALRPPAGFDPAPAGLAPKSPAPLGLQPLGHVVRGVIVYGDPHGEFAPLLQACRDAQPAGVVLLGDCGLLRPLREELRPLIDGGIRIFWIPGNHDTDGPDAYDRLWGDYPEGNLHARCAEIGGLVVAGLGGIFREEIWRPRRTGRNAVHQDRDAYLQQLPPTARWRDGLPLAARHAVFPEDMAALGAMDVDVLFTHQAPASHRRGEYGHDLAAQACRAKLVVHGHHHESSRGLLATGVPVRGLAKREVLRLRKKSLLELGGTRERDVRNTSTWPLRDVSSVSVPLPRTAHSETVRHNGFSIGLQPRG